MNTTEFIPQIVERRFNSRTQINPNVHEGLPIPDNFYLDLICAFHNPENFNAQDFKRYPLPVILFYLRNTHLMYLDKSLSDISLAIAGLSRNDKALLEFQFSLDTFFTEFKETLKTHIKEEELHLFPYLDQLIAMDSGQTTHQSIKKKTLTNFVHDHDHTLENKLGELVSAIENMKDKMSDYFSFRMLSNRLSIFELDLRVHAKIEEDVLLPMAFKLEEKLQGTSYDH